MNEIEYYLFLLRMAAVWHFAHAATCLIVILLIVIVALRIHIADTNALGPGSRRIVDMVVKDSLSRDEPLDRRRPFALCLFETIKRRFGWRR